MNKAKKTLRPSREPQDVPRGGWYYEDKRGFDIYIRWPSAEGDVTAYTRVLWRQIIKSLDRCGYDVKKREEPK